MDESRASNLRDFSVLNGELAPGADSLATVDGNGEPLFVINLCAAMTPIDLTSQALAGLSQYKLYQVSRMEDGRRRYRLRLGFFPTKADAEKVLSSLQARYATAFTSCLVEEDLKHATGYMKCSVKDLERTGRYAVLKVRGDSGATTTLRALDPALMQAQTTETTATHPVVIHPVISGQPPQKSVAPKATVSPIRATPTTQRAHQPSTLAPSLLEDLVVETSWQPAPPAAHKAPASKPAMTASSQQGAAPKYAAPANNTVVPPQAPKRTSLMQQAHAMAPMDAVERAKAVPGNSASAFVDTLATGKFKLPPITAPAQVQTAPTAPAPTRSAPAQAQQPIAATKAPPSKPATPAPAAARPIAHSAGNKAAPSNGVNLQTGSFAKTTSNITLEAQTPPPHTAAAPIQKANQAFHVGAGVNIPETMLSLAPSQPTTQAATHAKASTATAVSPVKPSVTQVSRVIAPTTEASTTDDLLRARALAKQSVQWRQDNGEVPTLDTTQTIRTLTKSELEDANSPKWFTVQLAISDHPANLDTMPKLDIFDAYSLYSVAVMEGAGIRHALRLGFFREEVSAMAVTGYLKTFFNDPIITRIPDAEHDRFVNAPKLSSITKPSANHVMLDEKHAAKHAPMTNMTNTVPTISAAVERTASMTKLSPQQPMAKSAAPATKRAPLTTPGKKPGNAGAKSAGNGQHDLLSEAALLGLSDTQILRVRKNPSLLSRLLGK